LSSELSAGKRSSGADEIHDWPKGIDVLPPQESDHLKNRLPWKIGLALNLAILATVGFWPEPVDKPFNGTMSTLLAYIHALGVPGWLNYDFVEAAANVVLFIPFGFLVASALPTKASWQLILLGTIVSACMELGQFFFMTARYPSALDVITNTAGTFIGIALVRSFPYVRGRGRVP